MTRTLSQAFGRAFMGQAPDWYKLTVVAFLVTNPIVLILFGPVVTGWVVLAQFIVTLAMALRCYPLQPGGLLAIEAVVIGLTTPESVYEEIVQAFPVILLLIFMVAGIYFLRDLLLYVFTRLILKIRSPASCTVSEPSRISPQLMSMSSSMRSYMGVLVASLSDGAGLQPYTEPRPVVKQIMLAPPATWPVAETGS